MTQKLAMFYPLKGLALTLGILILFVTCVAGEGHYSGDGKHIQKLLDSVEESVVESLQNRELNISIKKDELSNELEIRENIRDQAKEEYQEAVRIAEEKNEEWNRTAQLVESFKQELLEENERLDTEFGHFKNQMEAELEMVDKIRGCHVSLRLKPLQFGKNCNETQQCDGFLTCEDGECRSPLDGECVETPQCVQRATCVKYQCRSTIEGDGEGKACLKDDECVSHTCFGGQCYPVYHLASGQYSSGAITGSGNPTTWGTDQYSYGALNFGDQNQKYKSISAARTAYVGIHFDGSLSGSGKGSSEIPSGNNFVKVSGGSGHFLALTREGTVKVWGNAQWDMGTVPEGLNNVVDIAAGRRHNVVLKADGSLVGWTEYNKEDDWLKMPEGRFIKIAVGDREGCAIDYNRTLACWNHASNYRPNDITNVKQVAIRGYYNIALKYDGTLSVWNNYLDNAEYYPPPEVQGHVVEINENSGNSKQTVALLRNGTVVAWGLGSVDYGECDPPSEWNYFK